MTLPTWVVGFALSWVAAMAQNEEIALPHTPLRPGEHIVISIPGSEGQGSKFRWFVSAGRLLPPTNQSAVAFEVPAQGPVQIISTEESGHALILRNRSVLVAQDAGPENIRGATAPSKASYDIGRGGFAPSGWMGDGAKKGLRTDTSVDAPPGARGSRRWLYTPVKGGDGWAGVAYQYPPGNWGDQPGRDLSGNGYTELSVWARGIPDKSGRYPLVQFKAGGGADPAKKFRASFEAESDFVELTGSWKRYTVPLTGRDLTGVISAFTFVLRADDHPLGAELFIAQIEYR